MKKILIICVAAVVEITCATSHAGTLTWNGGKSGPWDATTDNWKDASGNKTAWIADSTASFSNTEAMTITVSGSISADNILGSSTGNITFQGSGTLAWRGWLQSQGHVYFENGLTLADNGNGLHFNGGAHVFLRNTANTYTGGTYIKNSNNTYSRAFSLDGGDLALGPLPTTPTDNIFAVGATDKNTCLYVSTRKTVELNANRKILIKDGCELRVCPQGTLRIKGIIHGEPASGSTFPTGTRIQSHLYYNNNANQWTGRTILDSGSGNINEFGRLYVLGDLEIASGTYRAITAEAKKTDENAPLFVKGHGAYDPHMGHLLVSGGRLENVQSSRYMQVNNYGQVDIAGGTVQMVGNAESEYLNALYTPAKTIIRDGGMLDVSLLRVSQATEGNGGEIFLLTNGILRISSMKLDYRQYPKGIVHFNGGKLQSRNGNSNTYVVDSPISNNWEDITFAVEAGGAIFDTSYGNHVWFGRPLVSGVVEGETDGGLTCLLGNGKAVVLTDCVTNSTYNGPTRLEPVGSETSGTRTLQCRVANALPVATTLQIGARCQAGFNMWTGARADLSQTVARVEGHGRVFNNSKFAVTGAVAPVFDGTYGTLSFEKAMPVAALSCDLEIAGDANGCGCVKFESAGQDISGLTLNVADISAFDKDAARGTYKILDAPNGYTGTFAVGNVADPWCVKYTSTAAYITYKKGMMLIIK